jgi:hypothetical protein
MNHARPTFVRVALVASLLAAGPALGAAMSTMGSMPREMTQGNVTYMSGGIGHNEAATMRKEEKNFPLSLEFVKRAKPSDQYLADVSVTIKGQDGRTALQTVSNGPFLLARLPDGKYTVSAEARGLTRTRDIVVAQGKPEHILFEW